MKLMKYFSLAFVFVLFGLTSCGGNKTDPYASKIKEDPNFKLVIDVKEYQSGESLDPINKFHVTLNDNIIDYENSKEDTITKGKYFITQSNKTPTLSRVKSNSLQLQSPTDTRNTTFYVAMISDDDTILYVSNSVTITIINKGALKPWVMWVGGAGVIIAASAIVFFTKKYKETHP